MSTNKTNRGRVDALRLKIASLRDELATLEEQARDRDGVREFARTVADRLHAEFNTRAARMQRVAAAGGRPSDGVAVFTSGGAEWLLAVGAIGPEALAGALLVGIEDNVLEIMPPAARTSRRAEVLAELDRSELEEEQLIEQSEADGAPVERRAEARPEIILALS